MMMLCGDRRLRQRSCGERGVRLHQTNVLPQSLACSAAKPHDPTFGDECRTVGHVRHIVGIDGHATGKGWRAAG
jgi:hypothetical protein